MSKRNENRLGYKKTRVGWIPVKWECMHIRNMRPFITSGSRGWAQYYSKNGDIFLRITNLSLENIFLDMNDTKYVAIPQGITEGMRTKVQSGDVLVSITAALGIIGYIDSHFPTPAYVSQHIALLRIGCEDIFSLYIAYFLAGTVAQKRFSQITDQGAKTGLNLNAIRNFSVAVPPLPEQKKISEILSVWDRAIEEVGKLIDAKQRFKKGLMQQLLSGRMRFPEFGKPVRKKGELPVGWKIKHIGSFGSFLKGKGISNSEKKGSGLPCVTYGEIYTKHEFVIKEFHSFIDRNTAPKSQRIQRNDILFAGSGETLDEIGKCVAHTKDIEAYAGGDIVIFRPRDVNPLYLSYSLNSDLLIRQKRKLGQGHSVVHIYSDGLKTLQVPLPSLRGTTPHRRSTFHLRPGN